MQAAGGFRKARWWAALHKGTGIASGPDYTAAQELCALQRQVGTMHGNIVPATLPRACPACLVHVIDVLGGAVLQSGGGFSAAPQRCSGRVAPLRHHAAQRPTQIRPQVSPQHDILQQWVVWAANASALCRHRLAACCSRCGHASRCCLRCYHCLKRYSRASGSPGRNGARCRRVECGSSASSGQLQGA
jgi:hypothetical protein